MVNESRYIRSHFSATDDVLSELEKKASKEFFRYFKRRAKKIVPDHPLWTAKGLHSWPFADCIVTTIDGTIVAVKRKPAKKNER